MKRILLFMGPPGCGKGTQATRVVTKNLAIHISTGDVLRQAIENKTGENPKDVLCKELLKRWKPSKKPYAH